MNDIRIMTLDPGHFHAALVQKEMYPNVSNRVHVYAPLGPDVLAHVQRIVGFNQRKTEPTTWELEMHAGPDYHQRLLAEKPGNVVVLAGRNAVKIDYIESAVDAGLHVLADKPWIIFSRDLPRMQSVLQKAEKNGLCAYDIMTERYEITSLLQRELVNAPDVFGEQVLGTVDEPGVFMESVHFLKKSVAGVPLQRPPWFFDIGQQGEGLSDVGTHLVDLTMWMPFPDQAVHHERDVKITAAKRWPTVLSREDFQQVTGSDAFPDFLSNQIQNNQLPYYCNTMVSYTVRGMHVRLNVLWDFEAAPGAGDSHLAVFHGTNSRVEVRQGAEENFRAELYVIPVDGKEDSVRKALANKIQSLQATYPGIALEEGTHQLHVVIPNVFRMGHEAHFAGVAKQFLRFLNGDAKAPDWENANMAAKYYVTTMGVERSQVE